MQTWGLKGVADEIDDDFSPWTADHGGENNLRARVSDSAERPLWAWRLEALLPWADKRLMGTSLEVEISALAGLPEVAPESMNSQVEAQIRRYRRVLTDLQATESRVRNAS